MKNILVIVGSPRRRGISARYADELSSSLGGLDTRVSRWNLAEASVCGCNGCEACRRSAARRAADLADGSSHPYCVIRDDMQKLYAMLDAADEVHLVSPVYFAGAPGQLKCVLDRLQPYWELRRGPHAVPGAADAPKRPVTLHVIGAGGDPFGFAPLETSVRSAFGAAGFRVAEVVDRIGWGQPESESQKQTFSAEGERDA